MYIKELPTAGFALGTCSDTTNGYVWYCDVHDTHGNADEYAEARHLADAHWAYKHGLEGGDEGDVCTLFIYERVGGVSSFTPPEG